MAPKKKKAPKNAFYFYMLDFQRNGPQGQYHGLREVADAAGASWKNLTPEKKRPFEDLAVREKGRSGNHDKYTTQGQSYADLDQEQRDAKNKILLMEKTIKDTLVGLGRNTGLATAPWFLIHINYFVKRDEGTYYAAEFALAKFTIQDGVHPKIYNTFVDPGDLPTGYSYKAKLHCDETHKCPMPPYVLPGARKGMEIVSQFEAFIEEMVGGGDEPLPPLYTLTNCVESVNNILGHWALEKGRKSDFYRIYPLENLFHDMKNFGLKPEGERLIIGGTTDNGFSHISIAELALNNDSYSFALKIACPFHEEEDVMNFCSKSFVRRWGWIMSNHLCRNLDIQMRPGAHCPPDVVPESLLMTAQTVHTGAGVRRDEPIKTRAAGRGIPIVRSSTSATPGPRMAPPSRSVQQPNAPPSQAWGSSASLPKPPDKAWRSDTKAEQFEDPPSRSSSRCGNDDAPLRLPKTTSMAAEIRNADKGATFTAEDFPAIGQLTIGLGRGRALGNNPPYNQSQSSDSEDSDEMTSVGRGWSTVGSRGGRRGGRF